MDVRCFNCGRCSRTSPSRPLDSHAPPSSRSGYPGMWEALQHAEWVSTFATNRWMYGFVSVIHHCAVLFSIGTIMLLDLRILAGHQNHEVSALAEQLRPWARIALASAVISGCLLFASQAAAYVEAT